MHPEVDERSEVIGWVPVRGNQRQEAPKTQLSISGLPQLVIMLAVVVGVGSFGSYFFVSSQKTQDQIQQAEQRAIAAEKQRFYQCINEGQQ